METVVIMELRLFRKTATHGNRGYHGAQAVSLFRLQTATPDLLGQFLIDTV